MMSDVVFLSSAWESMVYMSQANPKDNYYFYEFSFEGKLQRRRNNMIKGKKNFQIKINLAVRGNPELLTIFFNIL